MAKQYIKIRGANEHNLKDISVDIPRNELVVLDVYKRQLPDWNP